MNDYDFSRLNDKEFEVLCADLLSAVKGVRFERFKSGRDGGVDGRFFTPTGAEWILQAKHRPATPLPQLVTHLRNSEAPKAAALNPERYILMVSHSLTRLNKQEVVEALRSQVSSIIEIYDRADLNDLLFHYPVVERRHFKLWISSSTVLIGLLNNAISGRSEAIMRDILDKSKLFVQTGNFAAAVNKLNDLGTVIITGEAGIGKTTLAEQLILLYSSEGFELICISNDVHEAEQVYNPEQPQLFYFDDFLGRNYLHALRGHEGSQIVNFIKRVGRDRETKKFVLTSRSTILNQGRILNDVFEHSNVHRNEMEIKLDSLSILDKAYILYNHIWHSGLDSAHVDQFYADKRYWKVLRHRNFNPRLIQFITDPQRSCNIPAIEYWEHVQDLLNNPAKIWAHPFDAQLDDFGRFLVLLVAFNGKMILEQDVAAAYTKGISMPRHANFIGNRDYHYTIRHLSNSLLTRIVMSGKVYYKLFNPSLGDFLLHRYAENLESLEAVFACLRSQSALNVLLDMSSNDLVKNESRNKILMSLLEQEERLAFKGSDSEYLARLYLCTSKAISSISVTRIALSSEENIQRLKRITQAVLDNPIPNYYLDSLNLVKKSTVLEMVELDELLQFVLKAITSGAGSEELTILGDLILTLELNDIYEASEPLAILAHGLLCDGVYDVFDDSEVFSNGDSYSAARTQLERMIQSKFMTWQIMPTEAMVDEIVDAFDISERMRNYFDNEDYHYISPQAAQNRLEIMSVDDLFSRDR